MYEHLPRDATGSCDAVVWDAMDQERAETQHQQHDTDAAMLLERTEEKMVRENKLIILVWFFWCLYVSMLRFFVFFMILMATGVCLFHT